jgi:hypothetical protein
MNGAEGWYLRVPGRASTLNAERSGNLFAHRAETKAWRASAAWCARAEGFHPITVPVVIEAITYTVPPLADPGNHYPAVKATIDGLVDAGLLAQDRGAQIRAIIMLAPRKARSPAHEALYLWVAPCPPEQSSYLLDLPRMP